MLVQILDCTVELHHQEGTKMHLSDALSRISIHDGLVEKNNAKPVADFNMSIHNVEQITGFKQLSLQHIKKKTEADWDIKLFKQYIYDGFPNAKSCLPEEICVYFDYSKLFVCC